MTGYTIRGKAGIFDTGVSLLALSRVYLVSQLIETAAHQLAPLSMSNCFPQVPIVTSHYHLQGRGRCRVLMREAEVADVISTSSSAMLCLPSLSTPKIRCRSLPVVPPISSQWPDW